MRIPAIVLVFPLCAAFVAAQSTIVIPNGMATTEGNTSNAFPWGRTGIGLKIQNVYDSTNFTLQGVNIPVAITRLRWRPSTGVSSTASSYPLGATVKLSTCPVDQNSVTANFAANEGADLTTVWTGPVYWPAAAGTTGPCPFLIDLPLQTPFIYDPNLGDLNIETDLPVQTFTGTGLQLDVQQAPVLASRVYMSTGYPAGSIFTTLSHGVVVEVTYTPAAGYASTSVYGAGCYNASAPPDFASFYENFATSPSFDLGGSSMSLIPSGGGYTMIPGLTPFLPPTGAATALALTDDSFTPVTLGSAFPYNGGATTSLEVCSNGFVSVATGNGASFTPSSSGMLSAPQTAWWNWHDFNPATAGSGQVKFEEVGSVSYITWDGVWDFGGGAAANANTFQFQFDRTSGIVTMCWGTMSTLGGTGFLVGYSPGGASGDPGNRDLSASLPGGFTTRGTDLVALAHSSSARPVIGTSINLLTTNVPFGTLLGADILSFTRFNPGIDLTILGMPGCRQYVGLDTTLTFFPAGGTGSVAINIPNNPGFAGLHLFSQGAAFATGFNPLGVVAANGIDLKLDIN
jgi:hypothetical protein